MVTAATSPPLCDIPPPIPSATEAGEWAGSGLVAMGTKGSSSHDLISRHP